MSGGDEVHCFVAARRSGAGAELVVFSVYAYFRYLSAPSRLMFHHKRWRFFFVLLYVLMLLANVIFPHAAAYTYRLLLSR